MEESLEDRITTIERALGIDECTDAKAKDFDVAALQARLSKLGLDRVMKIPLAKLKKLKNLTNKPPTQSLSERLTTIEFCESLIRQRAELLKEFDERLELSCILFPVVLKTDKIGLVPQQEQELDAIQKDIEKGLEEWKKYTMELDTFKAEYFSVIGALRERLEEIECVISQAEKENEA
ncbi:unnamed protein product [Haemonchus placei]|uniref:Uncharacterized protein n=1 Tax=Haemonchus placei TaxID=6290 RepID=A0A0N4X500_HAEPC|nr:unnamed protein product [Haemonchus placei]